MRDLREWVRDWERTDWLLALLAVLTVAVTAAAVVRTLRAGVY